MKNWLDKLKGTASASPRETAVPQENQEPPIETLKYEMNMFSSEARARSDLFESLARKDGLTVLNGRYGGEYNNDQLAILVKPENTILLLGLKVTSESGETQLDQLSMGAYQQFSKNWLHMVIHSLKLDPTQIGHGEAIEKALSEKTMVLGTLILFRENEEVRMIRIETPE